MRNKRQSGMLEQERIMWDSFLCVLTRCVNRVFAMLPGRTVTYVFHNLLCQSWTWLMASAQPGEGHWFEKTLNEGENHSLLASEYKKHRKTLDLVVLELPREKQKEIFFKKNSLQWGCSLMADEGLEEVLLKQ